LSAVPEALGKCLWDLADNNEVKPLRLRPHPYEFFLYYDN
jgi:hypothetical protein